MFYTLSLTLPVPPPDGTTYPLRTLRPPGQAPRDLCLPWALSPAFVSLNPVPFPNLHEAFLIPSESISFLPSQNTFLHTYVFGVFAYVSNLLVCVRVSSLSCAGHPPEGRGCVVLRGHRVLGCQELEADRLFGDQVGF